MKLYTDRHPRGEDLGPGNGRKAGVGGWRIEPRARVNNGEAQRRWRAAHPEQKAQIQRDYRARLREERAA